MSSPDNAPGSTPGESPRACPPYAWATGSVPSQIVLGGTVLPGSGSGCSRGLPALPGGVADGAARASVLAPATLEVGLPALAPAVRADDVEGLPGPVPDPGDEAARDAIEAV